MLWCRTYNILCQRNILSKFVNDWCISLRLMLIYVKKGTNRYSDLLSFYCWEAVSGCSTVSSILLLNIEQQPSYLRRFSLTDTLPKVFVECVSMFCILLHIRLIQSSVTGSLSKLGIICGVVMRCFSIDH